MTNTSVLELGAVVLDDYRPPAPLSDLIVITAMTVDEWPDTKTAVEAHALPRQATAGVASCKWPGARHRMTLRVSRPLAGYNKSAP